MYTTLHRRSGLVRIPDYSWLSSGKVTRLLVETNPQHGEMQPFFCCYVIGEGRLDNCPARCSDHPFELQRNILLLAITLYAQLQCFALLPVQVEKFEKVVVRDRSAVDCEQPVAFLQARLVCR